MRHCRRATGCRCAALGGASSDRRDPERRVASLDATPTSDFYELVVERHRKKSTIWVSNREPSEWLTMTTDAFLAQSAVDRLTSRAHHLIIEGPSYRQRQRVGLDTKTDLRDAR